MTTDIVTLNGESSAVFASYTVKDDLLKLLMAMLHKRAGIEQTSHSAQFSAFLRRHEDELKALAEDHKGGYHSVPIPRGEYGEISKIKEELLEAMDAERQGNVVMVLIELSDIIGAIDGYLEKRYKGAVTVKELVKMAEATQEAFKTGGRT